MNQLQKILAALTLAIVAVPGVQAACTDPAGPKVDWSNCNKNGIRVPGANLAGAKFNNATFLDTAKFQADFTNANLAGADFLGANVGPANFSGANLAGARWTDGRVCATPSVGRCMAATTSTTSTTSTAATNQTQGNATTTTSSSGSSTSSGDSPQVLVTEANYESDFYWKKSYGRGAGTVPPLECESGKTQAGALCYDACRSGYTASGLSCVQAGGCPSGYSDRGLTCHYDGAAEYSPVGWDNCAWRTAKVNWGFGRTTGGDCVGGVKEDACRSGYSKNASMCYYTTMVSGMSGSALDPMKGSYQMGNAKAMVQVCRDGKGIQDGLCYTPCRSEYNGVGPVCWSKPPAKYVDCGAGVAISSAKCGEIIAFQTASVLFLAAEFLPTGNAANAAKYAEWTAKYPKVGQAVAKEGPALLKSLEATLKEVGPVASEINAALKVGKDISGPVNTMMAKIIPIMLKGEAFVNISKAMGMAAYGGYALTQDNEAARNYWASIRGSDALQLQIVRNVATVLSIVTAVPAMLVPSPNPWGALSGVFDVVSNYTWPI